MNTLKKLFSLCLALTLLMSLAVPASAFDLTIQGVSTGHTYVAYQIFAGSVSEEEVTDPNTHETTKVAKFAVDGWGTGVDDNTALLAALKSSTHFATTVEGVATNYFANANSALDIAEVLAKWTKGSDHVRKFAEIVAGFLTEDSANIYTATEGTDNKYTFSNLPGGYYLIMDADNDSGNLDYFTELMLEVSRDVTVSPKGDVPEVKKRVTVHADVPYEEAVSVSALDEVIFRLAGDLPTNYSDYETYFYQFNDNLGPNMVYAGNLHVRLHHTSTNTYTTVPTTAYTSVTDAVDTAGNHLITVTFDNLKNITTTQSDRIIVTYDAKLTGNYTVGGTGNINSVTLTYSNDPNFENENRRGTTPPDIAQVFTYALEIDKVDAATHARLGNAQFVLYRHVSHDEQTTEDGDGAQQHAEGIEYAVFENGKLASWLPVEENATVLTTANAGEALGKVKVSGLAGTTYHLKEIDSPEGYNKLDYDPTVVISPTFALSDDGVTYKVGTLAYTLNTTQDGTGNAANGTVTVQIENSAGQTLPSTGGMGTTLIYAAGGIMVLLAVVLLVTKKRMHNN